MTQSKRLGTFYLLPEIPKKKSELNFQYQFVCKLTKIKWRLGKSIFIACENELQAIQIDTLLWKIDQNSFLPHNLFRPPYLNNTPIIIYWGQHCYNNQSKDILINLMHENLHLFQNFNEIIDFVPEQNILKKWARIRYKTYKKTGFQISVLNASHDNIGY